MKKGIVIMLLGATILFGCVENSGSKADASVPEGFKVISNDEIAGYTDAIEIKHINTGCHYLYVDGDRDGGLAQMYKADGSPYCY